jgi:hypothetical protein
LLVECCEIVSIMFHIQQNNEKIHMSLYCLTTEKIRQFKQNEKVFPELNLSLSFLEHDLDSL